MTGALAGGALSRSLVQPPCLEQDSHQHQTNPALAFSSQLLEISKDALSTTSPGTYFRAVLLSWWNNFF